MNEIFLRFSVIENSRTSLLLRIRLRIDLSDFEVTTAESILN